MRDDLTLIKLETFYAACELRVLFLGKNKFIVCVPRHDACESCVLIAVAVLVLLSEFVAETRRQ